MEEEVAEWRRGRRREKEDEASQKPCQNI